MAQRQVSLLYVEDDPVARMIINDLLSASFPGLTIYQAEDGRQGLELFRKKSPQVVITDNQMPEMDGFALTNEIRKTDPDTFVIMLSGIQETTEHAGAHQARVDHFIRKPVLYEELGSAVKRALCRGTSPVTEKGES